ncbi:MAG: PEP-CTERM sorting domain-containing protein [Thiobacillus sp.]
MHARSIIFTAVLATCAPTTWAATANVDIYGNMNMNVDQPTSGTYSAAAEVAASFFTGNDYLTQSSYSTAPGSTASITGSSSPFPVSTPYAASASTTFGSNHAYAQGSTLPLGSFGVGSFSGWYDQVTINGGVGTGTASFTVQLNGIVDVGALPGGLTYALGSSSVHPSQLSSSLLSFNVLSSPLAWPMDAVNPIATHWIAASPYNDPAVLLGPPIVEPPSGIVGIPALPYSGNSLGSDFGMGFPVPDLVLIPGMGQSINITLTGTLDFTYGEAFYLIGGMGASVLNGQALAPFCTFDIGGETCAMPPADGTGATTLDFSNSANLVSIVLPQGASVNFASGEAYNVTAVPEPSEWLMLLAGLGLVGWRARRRS